MKSHHNPKRIFIALPVGQDIIDHVRSWQKTYSALPVRWLEDKNLHITLVPPWQEEYPSDIIAKLVAMPREIGPIPITFKETSFGPDPKHPRLIWAKSKAPKELLSLRTQVEKTVGTAPNNKPLSPHITLARFHPDDFKSFTVPLEKQIAWDTVISSIIVMESKLLPSGADYTVLSEIPL